MRRLLISALLVSMGLTGSSWAQCASDHREEKNGGILISDLMITGTRTVSTAELAKMTGELTGACFDDDSDEMGERVRATFQERGYFRAEVKHVSLKANDPLGNPKPVTMEAEVNEGELFRLAEIGFVGNQTFSTSKLREMFPAKKGAIFTTSKIRSGLQDLLKAYQARGFQDFEAVPETEIASNATVKVRIAVTEGPQYHMGKLEILADKDLADRLRLAWKLDEGAAYDSTYIDKYAERVQPPAGAVGSGLPAGNG
jgi:outer membrane protein assembly factor BamA